MAKQAPVDVEVIMHAPVEVMGDIRSFRGYIRDADIGSGLEQMRISVTVDGVGAPTRGTVVDCPHCGEKSWAK